MRLHPLNSNIQKPERFTWPFCYEPHPLCLLACEEVKHEIERIAPQEGKMFGVLVVEAEVSLGFLAAYSGLLEGRNDWEYFVPPVFDAQQPDGYFKQKEREISALNQHSANGNQTLNRQMSQELQLWLFRQYRMLNAKGEERDLVDIWRDYHQNPKIQKKFPLPPGGTGDCCAPKLLQYAYQHHLKPVCMAEFWWGPSPQSDIRHHGEFYPACRGKCKPVLTWMLQGLDVDPDPEHSGFLHQGIEIVYEDEHLAAVYKPAGMLSVPGKADEYSVATWAQERWQGAMLPHRLDLLTSGIMLVAKTPEVYRQLQSQFAARTIKKKYLAVVEGEVKEDHGIIDLPLSSDPLNRPRQIVDHENGKRAISEYRVMERGMRDGRPITVLALYPHTGRTHQLRMHCAHQEGLGCPIMGDELYGHKADRLYLQAETIAFVHPVSQKRMRFFCPSDKKIW
ncbi:RluA family pseudouridine synthase [Prevotella sp. P6B1]|uniref:RluA family pseudouridine synthase n=1 Tax=Prevotella sp. P6B1 TaxID=1410613 RepID=UPI00051AC5C1|nr:RluA family pseudouridine synthase [Prevotella sp. P6B1]